MISSFWLNRSVLDFAVAKVKRKQKLSPRQCMIVEPERPVRYAIDPTGMAKCKSAGFRPALLH